MLSTICKLSSAPL